MSLAFIACGGTGGHLSPGIALAEEMVSRGWKCELLISNKQIDSQLVSKYSIFGYSSLAGSGLSLSPIKFARFALNLIRGTASCMLKIKREKPDVVIGFGGFLSMPALLAGRLSGLPVALHEANRIPGRVTRTAGIFAHRLYLPRGVQLKTLRSSRIRYLGMPVRNEIQRIRNGMARERLGLNPSMKTLLVFGGSQGATSLNGWVKQNIETLAQEEIQVLCLTGSSGKSDTEFSFRSSKGVVVKSIFRQFSDDMALAISAADLVVSRAGAGSIAEVVRCKVPAILIPYPFAADDHQKANARFFERQGGGIMLEQKYLDSLLSEVRDIIYNDWLLQRFRTNLGLMFRVDPQGFMASDLEALCQKFNADRTLKSRIDGEREHSLKAKS